MIRINLLPFRVARKKENIRRQVSIFFLSIVMIALVLTWYTLGIDKKIVETRAQIVQVKAQIALYKEKADRVTEIKKKLKSFWRKQNSSRTTLSPRRATSTPRRSPTSLHCSLRKRVS